MSHSPRPPVTAGTAAQKARSPKTYTIDSRRRNRAEFLQGREAIEAFLRRKWNRELDYRLIKEVWAYPDNRIAMRFAYEWHDDSGQWYSSYGNGNGEFDEQGLMRLRIASINAPRSRITTGSFWPLGRHPKPDAACRSVRCRSRHSRLPPVVAP